jgi:hypothetical protein
VDYYLPIAKTGTFSMYFSYSETLKQLDDIKNGIDKPWGVLGKIISSVSHYEIWKENFKSITAWFQYFSELTGKSVSFLWRFRSCYENFLTLQERLPELGIKVPDVVNLSESLPAGHLELLFKLERVAPIDVMRDLYEKAFNGSITRATLQNQWSIFRKVLDGKTARGRNVTAPKRSARDAREIAIYLQAMLNIKLADNIDQLVNIFQCDSCHIFRDFNVKAIKFCFDAIVVSTFKSQNKIEIHALELISGPINFSKYQMVRKFEQYVDYFWFVIDECKIDNLSQLQNPRVGALVIDDQGIIKVVTMATKNVAASHVIVSDQILLNLL